MVAQPTVPALGGGRGGYKQEDQKFRTITGYVASSSVARVRVSTQASDILIFCPVKAIISLDSTASPVTTTHGGYPWRRYTIQRDKEDRKQGPGKQFEGWEGNDLPPREALTLSG